jgi:hypothetical protein
MPAAKKKPGRPKKTATKTTTKAKAKPAAKRRGRPRKTDGSVVEG